MFDKFSNSESGNSRAVDVVKSACDVDRGKRVKSFDLIEALMREHEQLDIPVTHRFHGDMYMREIWLEEDTLLTGHIHKFDHFDIMLSGDITVSTDDTEPQRFTGLNIFNGKAGKKRAGFVHKRCHWITIHSAEERPPEDMVEFLTVETFEQLEEFNQLLLEATTNLANSEQVLADCAKNIIGGS